MLSKFLFFGHFKSWTLSKYMHPKRFLCCFFFSEQNKNGKRTFTEAQSTYNRRRQNSVNPNFVYQEPYEWYDKCNKRPRNKGNPIYTFLNGPFSNLYITGILIKAASLRP